MTAHAAKGLEFKHVYIVGVEEELFPSSMAMSSLADIEEERRLLYVAITRAKESCVMTYAKSRFRNGQIKMMNPSRFIADINPKYLKFADSDDSPRKRDSPPENIPSTVSMKPPHTSTPGQIRLSMPHAQASGKSPEPLLPE